MKIAIISDAWLPQINGVVRTLMRTIEELQALGHQTHVVSPDLFRNLPCPSYAEIRLAVLPARRLARLLDGFQPCAIHIATEGPLGYAARRYCLARGLPFTTAFHTPAFPNTSRRASACRWAPDIRCCAGFTPRPAASWWPHSRWSAISMHGDFAI